MQTRVRGKAERLLRGASAAVLIILPLLSGCATDGTMRGPGTHTASLRVGRVFAEEGIARLKQDKFDEASRIFNAGLKFEPDNPTLHLLNGLTYHIQALRGDVSARELAEAGYKMTLKLDPGNFQAALQLARLYLDSREYAKAAAAFRNALAIDPKAGDAYLGLAVAAYYDRDLATATSAIKHAYSTASFQTDAARAAAIIYAATGDRVRSDEALSKFESLEHDAFVRKAVDRRVGQWRSWRTANHAPAGMPYATLAEGAAPLTPDLLSSQPESGSEASPAPAATPPAAPGATAPTTSAAASPPATPSNEPMQRRWTDCDTAPSNTSNLGTGGTTDTNDDTVSLPPLPVPCKGANLPRMAVFDVNILGTEDTSATSHGINLLQGLGLFFSYTKSSVLGASEGTTWGVGQLTDSGTQQAIAYSLNIANAANSRSEVLARPTLVALDRQPSTFFSGRTLTLGISGTAGGASTLADRPVGISLSLTPTFVNDDEMLLSVRAARSFLEQVDVSVNFGNSLQTSRNSVTANVALKFGQTLVLSGLTEHEIQRVSSGVPMLKDIPALQYLFSNKTAQNYTSSVIILITPRKPVRNAADVARAIAERKTGKRTYQLSAMVEDYLAMSQKAPTTLDSAIWHTRSNSMYFQFRDGDLRTTEWNDGTRLRKLLEDIRELIYY